MIRFASLGSGSRGNALVVDAGDTRLLVDCGFSLRTTLARLERLGIAAESISALVVTHEHGDHIDGVCRFARRYARPVYLTQGSFFSLPTDEAAAMDIRIIDSHEAFAVGSLAVQPFPVPHDAREPVQFTFSDGARRLGVLTDCGTITVHVVDRLRQCDALVIECNHDAELLRASAYPPALKRRILGHQGHLDNAQAAGLFARIDMRRLQHIVAAHLSAQNNTPQLAIDALCAALDCTPDWIAIADQESGVGWRQLK